MWTCVAKCLPPAAMGRNPSRSDRHHAMSPGSGPRSSAGRLPIQENAVRFNGLQVGWAVVGTRRMVLELRRGRGSPRWLPKSEARTSMRVGHASQSASLSPSPTWSRGRPSGPDGRCPRSSGASSRRGGASAGTSPGRYPSPHWVAAATRTPPVASRRFWSRSGGGDRHRRHGAARCGGRCGRRRPRC